MGSGWLDGCNWSYDTSKDRFSRKGSNAQYLTPDTKWKSPDILANNFPFKEALLVTDIWRLFQHATQTIQNFRKTAKVLQRGKDLYEMMIHINTLASERNANTRKSKKKLTK